MQYTEADEAVIPALTAALRQAGETIGRWGGLSQPVTVWIQPDHPSLERAIGHPGFPWLRAWAQYQTVQLQSPRTWGIPYESQLVELLCHELTHVAMYQAIGGPDDWEKREIPLWFREGMASVSAAQGYRRGSEAEIAARLKLEPVDPFRSDEEVLRLHKDLIYNCSHWAFRFLLLLTGSEEEGTARVRELLRRVRDDDSFAEAFEAVWGMGEAEFQHRWLRHVGAEAGVS